MNIVDAQTIVAGNSWKNWVFLKRLTDEGIVGLGEATDGLSTRPGTIAAINDDDDRRQLG